MALKFDQLSAEEEKLRSFHVQSKPGQIIVIGCGGTGGYVIPDLFRAIRFAYPDDYDRAAITLIDGDLVENKNIQRQNFIEKDLGKYKSEVLAKRYGQAFGLEVAYITSYLETPDALAQLVNDPSRAERSHSSLIISCVDSLAARKLIFDTLSNISWPYSTSYPHYWIDSGNEDVFGQVILSSSTNCMPKERRLEQLQITRSLNSIHLPSIAEIFPHILEVKGSARPQVNCAVQAEEHPQNILINRVAATVVLSYVYKIIYQLPITAFMTTFDVNKGSHDELITYKNLRKIWQQAYGKSFRS